jgi:hypothetical protein
MLGFGAKFGTKDQAIGALLTQKHGGGPSGITPKPRPNSLSGALHSPSGRRTVPAALDINVLKPYRTLRKPV